MNKHRAYQHRAAGSEFDLVEPAPVPGRVIPASPGHQQALPASTALRSARGALRRLDAGLAQLDEATRAGRAVSPMLVLDVRSALTRAEAALAQADADPTWDEVRTAHAELAPRTRTALDAQAALATPDATHAALAADVETMAGRLGLGRIDVRTGAAARSLTDAHGARGVALGESIHLHPDADTDVIAHELIHLAQSRLSRMGDDDRAAAETEAGALAPQLAGGASVRPSRYIDLSRPAADTHADEVRFLRSGPDAVTQARTLVDDATTAYEDIYLRYLANEREDVASFELVPELASVGKSLAWARTELLSDSLLPESRKHLIPALLDTIDAYAKQVILLEMQLRGASETAEAMGKPAPELTKKKVKASDGPLSGRDAQSYIATTPIVGDAILRGAFGEQFGKIKVAFYDTRDSFEQVYVNKNGDGKATDEELRARSHTVEGFTHPGNRIPNVCRPGSPPATTIHEVLHAVADPLVEIYSLGEGLAEYFTRMVCEHHGLPFSGRYAQEVAVVEKLVAETSLEAVAELGFRDGTLMEPVLDSKGAGTWDKFEGLLEEKKYNLAAQLLEGLRESNERRIADEAEQKAHAAADRDAATHAADPPMDQWPPEAAVATGPFGALHVDGPDPYIEVFRGGRHGVRKTGWIGTIPLEDGTTIVAPVIEVFYDRCRLRVPEGLRVNGSHKVILRKAP